MSPAAERLAPAARAAELRDASREWPSWDLTPRQICDLELLLNGAFAPLTGFLGPADFNRVLAEMRLADGTLWPMPITLDISEEFAARIGAGMHLALRDPEGVMLAVLQVETVWQPGRQAQAAAVFGTTDAAHPGVRDLLEATGPFAVAGRLEGVQLPVHYDYRALRVTPAELRARFAAAGHTRVVAFQTRNPLHRAHLALTERAARAADAHLLVHPAVGLTKPGDVDHYTRVRCYQAAMRAYAPGMATLALLPLAMRMAGPREALWHALIRRNYGCTHFIVGRDHAGPGADAAVRPFYGPYDAQELVRRHAGEIGIEMVPFREMVYVPDDRQFVPDDEVPAGKQTAVISGSEFRRRLQEGEPIPEWFSPPDVVAELRRTHPSKAAQGCVIFFTGLSGSGKSTIAQVLQVKLLERGGRAVTMLDGDVVRKHLSSELGFSREHRDLNIRRVGFVAAEVARHGGIVLCAAIAPYDATRKDVRGMVEAAGGRFILVHVATSLEVCEARDRKGLYAKARAGIIPEFTGISDPYEVPTDAEIVIPAAEVAAETAADRILALLA